MRDADEALRTMAEQIHALQHELAEQRQTAAQQQAELTALRVQVEDANHTNEAAAIKGSGHGGTKTSRRRLFTTAGAAAAAATAAAVALGATNASVAQAATGSDWVLGESTNTAGVTTYLYPSSSTTPNPLLEIDNSTVTECGGLYALGGTDSYGVWGQADGTDGIGVYGSSAAGYGGGFFGVTAALQLGSFASKTGAPTTNFHNVGDLYVDSAATLWVCTIEGNPGAFVRLTSVLSTAIGGATTYLTKPIRLLDTRSGASDALNNGGGPYVSGSTHSLTIAGVTFSGVTVPSPIAGGMGKITATNTTGSGFIALLPHGVAFTGTANLPFSAGETVAIWFNSAVASGELDIFVSGASTDVILDLFAVVS